MNLANLREQVIDVIRKEKNRTQSLHIDISDYMDLVDELGSTVQFINDAIYLKYGPVVFHIYAGNLLKPKKKAKK